MSRASIEDDAISDIRYLFNQPNIINIEDDALTVTNEDKQCVIFYLTPDEMLRLAANAACDVPWAAISALGINVNGEKTAAFLPATVAQFTYSMPLPFLLCIVATGVSQKISLQKTSATFLSLLIGMICWNIGQYYGEKLFTQWGMSDKNAGYAASLCAGPSEGVIQCFLYDAVLAAMGDKETKENYRKFKQNSLRASLFFISYFLTSSLSGVIWQIIYNAIFPNCTNTPDDCTNSTIKNVILVSLAVGLGVAATSYASGVAFKGSVQCLNKFFSATTPAAQSGDLAEHLLNDMDVSVQRID